MHTLTFLVIVSVLTNTQGLVDIGKYIQTCDRNSPEVNECLVEAVQDGIAVMSDGIKDLGVPAVDPYLQKELRVEYNNNQILAKMVFKDIYIYGLRTATVHDARLKADEDRFNLEIDLTSPRVFVTGKYIGEGSYNALKIEATRGFNASMTDLVYTWKLKGTPEKIKNETYVRIKSFYMRPDVGNMMTDFWNDNPETRPYTDLGASFANSNWKLLYREFLPFAQSNWDRIGTRVANKLFLKVPYDQLFPTKS